MTKKEFIVKWSEILATKYQTKISKNDLGKALDACYDIFENMLNQEITEENKNDIKVTLPFGVFRVYWTKARTAKKPITREIIEIPAAKKLKFKPNKKFKTTIIS